MIRASGALTAKRAATYYRREYTRGDYYTSDRTSSTGTWQGRGAERLGLAGEVQPETFAALLEGRSPLDGSQLVAAEAATGKHRAAWDFSIAPDKSVSLVALVGGDRRVVAAHLRAAARAFEAIEQHAGTGRGSQIVPTGNLVIARFDHDSSRALDPHLHSHQVIFNLTDRARRGQAEWRALEPRGLYAAQSLGTAIYHAELARELQALGYEVRANPRGLVRILGIPEAALAAFSKRRRQILDELERRGGSAADSQRAALRTRARKDRDVDPAALRQAWRAEADRQGVDFAALRRAADDRVLAGRHLPPGDPLAQARASAAWAVEHLSERQAAFRHLDLETSALRHGAARGPGLDEVRAALAAHPGLLEGAAGLMTTEAALRLEQRNLELVRAGQLPCGRPVLDRPYVARATSLAADQLRVVRHILESREQVLGVEGKPGTGKTFTLTAVRDAAEAAGWSVRGFAVTTGAVAQLRAVGLEAATLKSLQAHPPDSPSPRQLWIVDEASLMSNRDAATALESAQRAGARLVFVGDRLQHHAVEAGHPWASFQVAGLRPAQLDVIRRQQDPELLAAVELSAQGRAGDAIRHLDGRGHVVEIASARERHAAMVRDFAAAPRRTLMIAPSHAERRDLNFLARRELVAGGRISPEAIAVEVAVGKGLTAAQRADPRNYEVGDVVAYPRAARSRGFHAGDTARVLAVDPERHILRVERHRDGALVDYDPRRLRGGDLARVETRQLAAGDRVQFRRADPALSIPNGATATVREAAAPGRLVLQLDGPAGRSGRTVTLAPGRGPLPLDYAYAVTSHAAQGATVRRVLATFDTRHSAELVNRQQAHVTLSRASHQLVVYTDDRSALPGAVDRRASKTSALDVQLPSRSDNHAPSPLHRDASRRDATGREPSEPARRAPRRARGPAAEPDPAAGRRPRARPGRRADRPQRPRDPGPRPGADREPRQEPRPHRAAHRGRRSLAPAERGSPLRRDRRPLHARDPDRPRSPLERPRSPAPPLAQRLIAAAERWRSTHAGHGAVARQERPFAPAAAAPRQERPAALAPPTPLRVRPGFGNRPLRVALAAPPAARVVSALVRAEDAERHLVGLIKEVGVGRALALLPPALARAVQSVREVARLLAGLSRDR
jgi:conjugative relaxase-like TrwC/TraI family protein